jgi:hypothetical protein
MESLPFTYFLSALLIVILGYFGLANIKEPWGVPYLASLGMVFAWYFIEPISFSEDFGVFSEEEVALAFQTVIIFLMAFGSGTYLLSDRIVGRSDTNKKQVVEVPLEKVALACVITWGVLLSYGTYRMDGDVIGALFPIDSRNGSNMWSRAAGAGAGSDGFIVATASYLYTVSLSLLGLLFVFIKNHRHRTLMGGLILIAWPYAFLQGSRNVTLAVVLPAVVCFLIYGPRSLIIRLSSSIAAFTILEYALRLVIQYRNIGFRSVDTSEVISTKHFGLNMASELVYGTQFVSKGTVSISYGMGYVNELLNAVPRAIWEDKPLLGIEYALARGYRDSSIDIGVFATISSGIIGQGVLNFGLIAGPIIAGFLLSVWTLLLGRFRRQDTPLRKCLFLIGIGLTFNLGRDITLLVLWPFVFSYFGVSLLERQHGTTARHSGMMPVKIP